MATKKASPGPCGDIEYFRASLDESTRRVANVKRYMESETAAGRRYNAKSALDLYRGHRADAKMFRRSLKEAEKACRAAKKAAR